MIIFIILGIFPLFALITLLTLPLAIKAIKVTETNKNKVYELLPANASTIITHFAFGACLIIAYVIDKFVLL